MAEKADSKAASVRMAFLIIFPFPSLQNFALWIFSVQIFLFGWSLFDLLCRPPSRPEGALENIVLVSKLDLGNEETSTEAPPSMR